MKFHTWWDAQVRMWTGWVHEPTRRDIGYTAWVAGAAAEREACALIVCPQPEVEEERECKDIAARIRARRTA
jgi:hypothetical protein